MTHDHHPESCAECGAVDELYLHSRCHTSSPTWAVLNQAEGTLKVICATCKKPVAKFKLADPARPLG